jgi:hypothetical protein
MRPQVADEVLVWVYVTEDLPFEDALKLAKERDAAAATELKQDALKLRNMEKAAAIAVDPMSMANKKNAVLLAEFGY